ncbi:unnamed protein product [Schistocephalus solidus]|uniref:RING-type domain-containing protein n=1 Tax=Schistocephalus solidus TaxID=70667 RepID=A0A183SHQ2_SCHSO|nr:unnamed protein product [Schistocephalus solidus]
MEESEYFERLREAHNDFVNTYRSVGGFNYSNTEEPQPVMYNQESEYVSCPIFQFKSDIQFFTKYIYRLRHLPCGHSFHAECIDRWLRTAENCPKCRDNVVRALARLKVQALRRRTRSAENNSTSAPEHTTSLPTINTFRVRAFEPEKFYYFIKLTLFCNILSVYI